MTNIRELMKMKPSKPTLAKFKRKYECHAVRWETLRKRECTKQIIYDVVEKVLWLTAFSLGLVLFMTQA